MGKSLKEGQDLIREALSANERLASKYHEWTMDCQDEKARDGFLEMEAKVRRDQEELKQAAQLILSLTPNKEESP